MSPSPAPAPVNAAKRERQKDRLLPWAIGVTVLILAAAVWFFVDRGVWTSDPDKVGGFLSGVSGSLAFLWLLMAYRSQREELHLQWEELRENNATQAAQQRAMELQADVMAQQLAILEEDAVSKFDPVFERRVPTGLNEADGPVVVLINLGGPASSIFIDRVSPATGRAIFRHTSQGFTQHWARGDSFAIQLPPTRQPHSELEISYQWPNGQNRFQTLRVGHGLSQSFDVLRRGRVHDEAGAA